MDLGLKIRMKSKFFTSIRYDPLRPTEELIQVYCIDAKNWIFADFFTILKHVRSV